jgi:hypothetical protein
MGPAGKAISKIQKFSSLRHKSVTGTNSSPVQQSYSQSPGIHLQAVLKSLHSMSSQPFIIIPTHVDSTSKSILEHLRTFVTSRHMEQDFIQE